jgi:hypothetical protein
MAQTGARDWSLWGFAAALFLAALSYFSMAACVHTYCENRPVMLALAVLGLGTTCFLIRFWPSSKLRRVGTILAILLCLLEIAFNAWFFLWATKVCAEQKRLN